MMAFLQGSHSTKIVGITRVLLNIQTRAARCQVSRLLLGTSLHHHSHRLTVCGFMHDIMHIPPQWLDILDLIARALRDNDIKFSFLKTKRTFQVCYGARQQGLIGFLSLSVLPM